MSSIPVRLDLVAAVPGPWSGRTGYCRLASRIRLLVEHDVAQDLHAMEGLLTLIAALLRSALALFRSRSPQAIVWIALCPNGYFTLI